MRSKTYYQYLAGITFAIIALVAVSCDDDGDDIVPDQVPAVTTTAVFNITESSATSGGNITENYDSPVTARGVCWGTDSNPDVSGNKTIDGLGIGPFESNITGLVPGQVYYVRAYATNASGNGYGSSIQFTTLGNQAQVPSVTTTIVTSITTNSAISGGEITSDNGSTVTSRGVCWSTSPSPTINDSKTIDGTGIGSFQSNLTGLSTEQSYYVRAYATNAAGTGYGNALQFQTLAGSSTVTDGDGNTYNTVTIGTQVWLKENLITTKYNDGTSIPHEENGQGWQHMTTPAYTWYDDNYDEIGSVYGALYNWYVTDPASNGNKNICPAGWHVPSKSEVELLTEYLGGSGVAGGKLKEEGSDHWDAPNVGATNESGFTALGSGGIGANYSWNLRKATAFWTTTERETNEDWSYYFGSITRQNDNAGTSSAPKWHGTALRCVKD